MDGPSSRFPSTSISSTTNPDRGASLSSVPRQSLKELFSSVNSVPATSIDPPRPAKEGYEWVWFPGGYWAEREIVETPPKDSTKAFGWRKRSTKSSSGSFKHSPQTPLAEKMEASLEHSAGGRVLTRTTTSSESGGSFFPLNRMPDAPLPSPYLTEEAHVQSLQWPSIDAAARRSSTSESSMFRSRVGLAPSPLHFSQAEDELEQDRISPSTVRAQPGTFPSSDTINTELLTPSAATTAGGRGPKPEKSFIKWRMLSEQRQRLRRSQASSDENTGGDVTQVQSLRPQGATASPLRKASNISDKSRKSFKGFPTKLLRKARWPRRISNSSAASTSSSLPASVHSHSPTPPGSEKGDPIVTANAWASEYPGGEAIRVQTPRTEQFPRSFFQDLSPSSTPRRPHSRQEGQVNLKKTNLSTSFTPSDYSTSSTPRLHHDSDTGSVIRDSSSKQPRTPRVENSSNVVRTPDSSRRARKERHACKEWWEVSVPTSYAAIDQRTPFKFDMPEHLPSSPMCPTNKRHKSGGTGVCVYHGRAKRQVRTLSGGESPGGRRGRGEEGGGGRGEDEDDDEGGNGELEVYDEDCADGSDVWK
ncbi:hypothetical protein F5Y09DRAFT_2518 [Xylaria sp. FL1042]|nr:hypothetical protein F5Y09DRAFT_1812 [Xylaria sp. FL1042]KAI0435358.1 hypothetical protein F5Y09DRAFT_2518 [Xylaria sp. FL1042]